MPNFSILFCVIGILCSFSSTAQQASYFDPAVAYTKLLIDRNSNEAGQQRIGNFKVNGTSLFYGEGLDGEVYFNGNVINKGKIYYNTYNQQIEFNTSSNIKMLFKSTEVDSFYLLRTNELNIIDKFSFVSSKFFDKKYNTFLIKLVSNSRLNLFKEYKSDLGVVSTNYINSDLRQFDLKVLYWFKNIENIEGKINSIKLNKVWLKKNFANFDSVINLADAFSISTQPDLFLISFFNYL